VSKLLAVLFNLCLLLTSNALAGTTIPHLVMDPLFDIEAAGGDSVGDIPLRTLMRELVVVRVLSSPAPLIGGGFRTGAVNFAETKVVVIYEPFIQQNSFDENQQLFTHEYLEAAGYDDRDYQITTMIKTLSTSKQPKELNRSLFGFYKSPPKNTKNRPYQMALRGGTTTGVGSGGDPKAALAKAWFAGIWLRQIQEEEAKTGVSQEELRKEILNLQFEVTLDLQKPTFEVSKLIRTSQITIVVGSGFSTTYMPLFFLLQREVLRVMKL
jgi:hypothetical protein